MYPQNMPKFSLSTAMAASNRWEERCEIARVKHEAKEAKQKAHDRAMQRKEDAEKARCIAMELEKEATLEKRAEAALKPTSEAVFEIKLPTEEELLMLQKPPRCVFEDINPDVHKWNCDFIYRKREGYGLWETSVFEEPHPDVDKSNVDFINRKQERYEVCETSVWFRRAIASAHAISSTADSA